LSDQTVRVPWSKQSKLNGIRETRVKSQNYREAV
jgi:hypothetical protein